MIILNRIWGEVSQVQKQCSSRAANCACRIPGDISYIVPAYIIIWFENVTQHPYVHVKYSYMSMKIDNN